MKFFKGLEKIEVYKKDKRKSIFELYEKYFLLVDKYGWQVDVLFFEKIKSRDNKKILIPALSFRTKKSGETFWILSGIHGEEPSGPNALANSIKKIASLGKKMPVMFLPLLNPLGYIKNFRYPNEYRDWKIGKSVGDAKFVLLKKNNRVRKNFKPCRQAKFLINYIIKISKKYKPIISIDHHEDELISKSYIYSQGKMGQKDPIALMIANSLKSLDGKLLKKSGRTRFGEKIVNGIIGNTKDGSVDELLSSKKVILNNKIYIGPSSRTSIVVETPIKNKSLKERVKIHKSVINIYNKLVIKYYEKDKRD